MSERLCAGSATTRRRFLTTLASATAISAVDGLAAPAFSRLSQRPTITHGAPSKEQGQNLPPSEGLQFFGHVAIDGASQQMTVTLKDIDDRSLWAKTLDPKLG